MTATDCAVLEEIVGDAVRGGPGVAARVQELAGVEDCVLGVFPGPDEHSTTRDVAVLGEPELVEEARRSYPGFLVYEDIEFRLRDDRLIAIAVTFSDDRPTDGGSLAVTGFWPVERRAVGAVEDVLSPAGASYRLDTLMSDPGSPVWITDRQVQVAFYEGVLNKVAAEYGTSLGGSTRSD